MADRWRVTAQRATERYMSNGRFENVVEVTIETAGGTTKTFAIPEGQYTADNVRDAINEWVERENAVSELRG